ncbi:MAG: trypsin-like peptidase domain-containing protein [Planctomycetes bacterium]|nr:trypsin-like peptidase domain-containing protein [Planctomycetota bacterium]
MTRAGLLVAALFLGAAWALLGSETPREAARTERKLLPGKPAQVKLREAEDWRTDFVLEVPEDAIALRLVLHAGVDDLALHAEPDELPDDPSDAAYRAASDGGVAELLVDRFSHPPLAHGRLAIALDWEGRGEPASSERHFEALECTLAANIYLSSEGAPLADGRWVESVLPPHSSGTQSFRVDPPAGAQLVRIDLDGVQGDLDLYARRGAPVGEIGPGLSFARHLYGRETLVLGDDEALGTGPWFVDVVDVSEEEGPVRFRIACRAGAQVPPELAALPALPASFPGALGKSLPPVVELFAGESTGSGTLVSQDGWILTNAHVVTAMGGGRERELVVACTLDPHEAPLELFRAEVREFDEARDLALLQITKGFYGQPVPEGYAFPVLELGDPAALGIGDPLLLAGYPSTGTLGSLVTLHVTRGIVSGFDRAPQGSVIKTDAEITGGNSGGAALDEHGKLVGIPTMVVEMASGQAGYVHPVSWLPEDWKKHFAPAQKR